jgi:phage shock protein PspC (stress-responsive transcriptional regulator)
LGEIPRETKVSEERIGVVTLCREGECEHAGISGDFLWEVTFVCVLFMMVTLPIHILQSIDVYIIFCLKNESKVYFTV